MYLVIVESPAKSKTISKYLGKDYKILASFGHVRDLPSANDSVEPTNKFKMHYQIKDGAKRSVDAIVEAAKKADCIYMASDQDREGEAIAWNIAEILKQKKITAEIKRATFTEITKSAVLNAIKNPRLIDHDLVDAQQARLCLDYLVGFHLSPVLWKKLPGSRSAGRVQSVALRKIVDREEEIRAFVPSEYWSVNLILSTKDKKQFAARIVEYKGKKFNNQYPKDQKTAKEIEKILLKDKKLQIVEIEEKDVKRNPFAPFNTASLQQDASNKLGFSPDRTMRIAQKLYEGVEIKNETKGLITYMRTDGTNLAAEAIDSIRSYISDQLGSKYLPKSPRIYKTKTKNAQEAHEAIRPTDIFLEPKDALKYLDKDEAKLYELIWKRAIASQVAEAVFTRQSIDFKNLENNILARATGSVVKFDGFLRIYETYMEDEDSGSLLPKMKVDDNVDIIEPIESKQHFTSPKARFTEAGLIKELEEHGIGRPSTYAMIIKVLQEREYVYIDKKQFHPDTKGISVTFFLKSFFLRYVEYDFTAQMENDLDLVSDGKMKKLALLDNFWENFDKSIQNAMTIDLSLISKEIGIMADKYLFSGTFEESRKCTACSSKNIELRTGKYGIYINCQDCNANISIDKYLNTKSGESSGYVQQNADECLGNDDSGNKIYSKSGRFGPYVELQSEKNTVIKRASIPKNTDINLEKAKILLSMPIKLGLHEKNEVIFSIGKFGPYILCEKKYYRIPNDKDLFNITLKDGIEIMHSAPKKEDGKSYAREKKTIELGTHPKTGKKILAGKSKYGIYALYQKKFFTIKGIENIEDLTLEMAVDIIDNQ